MDSTLPAGLEDVIKRLAEVRDRASLAQAIRSFPSSVTGSVSVLERITDKCREVLYFEAAVVFGERLLSLDRSAHHADCLSRSYESLGRNLDATRVAVEAAELDQASFEYNFRAGYLSIVTEDFSTSRTYLDRAMEIQPFNPDALGNASVVYEKLGFLREAVVLASKAYSLNRSNPHYCLVAAHFMMVGRDFKGACEFLEAARTDVGDNMNFRRVYSGALDQLGEFENALEQITIAIQQAPGNAEFMLHRAGILVNLERHREALEAAQLALTLDPENTHIRRHLITILLELGQSEEAVKEAANLLAKNPKHDEYAQCMQHVLFHREGGSFGLGDILEQKRRGERRRHFAEPAFWQKTVAQMRVVGALFLREMRARFGETRLGYVWVVAEPMIHMVALAVVFQFTMKGKPPLGDSFFFFYFTGLMPYQLFIHTTEQVAGAIPHTRTLLQLPPINNLASMYSRALLELYTTFLVIILFMLGFAVFHVNPIPADIPVALLSLLMTWLLALGIGIFNGVVNAHLHAWHHIFQIIQRFLYFTSGIFYVPGMMPIEIREILVWNPLLHGVDWFRTSFFTNYQPSWMAPSFLCVCVLLALALGLSLEAASRRRLRRVA